ncbi:hypothetical protein F4677DRAFT_451684 [Hypoxylon crocopeplum]|nr:hypothetical protein F4677DRAFT_451684 [Hypoxylon crocopeplum]
MTPTHIVQQYWNTHGFHVIVFRAALRTLQFVFAIVAAALYGVDISNWTRAHVKVDSQWMVAEILAALSAVTCIIHCFATVTHVSWCVWDAVLALVWAVMAILTAQIVFSRKMLKDNDSIPKEYTATVLKAASFIDLVSMLLWLATVAEGLSYCCVVKRNKRKTNIMASNMEILEDGNRFGVENELR